MFTHITIILIGLQLLVLRPSDLAQQRVAQTEHPQVTISHSVQGGDRTPAFNFGDSRGIPIFSYM